MKKILALLLAVLMLFALAACGEDSKSGDGDKGGNGGDKTTASKEDTSYESALKDFMQGFFGFDTDKLNNSAPAIVLDEGTLYEAKWAAENNNYEEMYYLIGGDFTMEVTKIVKGELSDSDKALVIAKYGEMSMNAQDAVVLTVTVKFEGNGVTEEQNLDAQMVKIDGVWYVAEWQLYEGQCYSTSFKVLSMISG